MILSDLMIHMVYTVFNEFYVVGYYYNFFYLVVIITNF